MNAGFGAREFAVDDRTLVAESGLFDADFYLRHRPELAESGVDPILHYLNEGWHQEVDPGPSFSTHFYLTLNDDVREAGVNPLVHYIRYGRAEGRQPIPSPQRTDDAVGEVCKPTAPTDEEWEALIASWRLSPEEPQVDVLVPVYCGIDETMRCLFSVLEAAQQTPYRLVVVDDCSPEPALCSALKKVAESGLIELHRTPENLGFVGACNLGMLLHSNRDVVLLNSDTEVFGDWLDRLRVAALRGSRTATVTPLSNNAEICSYPKFIQDNWRKLEISDAELDDLAARVNGDAEVEVPTGVGFCMYVRRQCLNEIGLFDRQSFGHGYGEENDLCLRAAAAGWRNILVPNTFVRHYGATSFGPTKLARVKAAINTVERLHPGYLKSVEEFIRFDPIKPYRRALDEARLARRAGHGAVLFVTHSWGGGTERHVQDLSRLLELDGVPVFICRVEPDDPVRIRIEDPGAPETPNLPSIDVERDLYVFVDLLRRIAIMHVHVQHLAGFTTGIHDFLRTAFRLAGLAYDVTIHDYKAVCPRITLIDHSGLYCGEPDLETCETCVSRSGSPFGYPSVWEWRDRHSRFYAGARKIFVPDVDVARRLRRLIPDLAPVVRPHPEPERAMLKRDMGKPIILPQIPSRRDETIRRIVILGAIGPHKGSELLVRTARAARSRGLPLEFIVIGYTDRDDELRSCGNVTITGRYDEPEAETLLNAADGDFGWFPAVWPETYSYTLSSVLKVGLFPVAFDFGAIANRIRNARYGELMSLELMLDPPGIAQRFAELPIQRTPSRPIFEPACYASPLLTSYYEFELGKRAPL